MGYYECAFELNASLSYKIMSHFLKFRELFWISCEKFSLKSKMLNHEFYLSKSRHRLIMWIFGLPQFSGRIHQYISNMPQLCERHMIPWWLLHCYDKRLWWQESNSHFYLTLILYNSILNNVHSFTRSLGGALYIMFENHVHSWPLLKTPLYTRGYMSLNTFVYICVPF